MFEIAAGQVERPLKERSSLATTLISSLAHGGALVVGVIVLTLSQGIALPKPQDASNLIAILVAGRASDPGPGRALGQGLVSKAALALGPGCRSRDSSPYASVQVWRPHSSSTVSNQPIRLMRWRRGSRARSS